MFCLGLLLLLALSGCATLSETDCRSGDWYGVGLQDGENGQSLSRLSEHREACSEFGINIDGERYRQGRDQGLLKYCTPENGARVGRSGGSYGNVCPAGLDAEFLRQYRFGYKIFEVEQALEQIDSRIAAIDSELAQKDLSDDKRRQLRRERDDLEDEHDDRERELRVLDAVDLLRR
ncbi:DUF2799 domain-containing protein [Permianibacter fluminis]|uniref:DUF2799 domain-containing protein n=1 Tax=Permianibacter fluminis TaxID=2738515 RepID=UPI001F32F56A|nr:DUF2799 domain-containing protein [Permianibacter fluminis]